MPVGPQRKQGFVNTVRHPSGQVSQRRSDTQYTHAVVKRVSTARERERLTGAVAFYERVQHDEPAYARGLRRTRKELESLPDHPHTYSVASYHGSEQAAHRKRGSGGTVVPVEHD
jgi:hypothetical protein